MPIRGSVEQAMGIAKDDKVTVINVYDKAQEAHRQLAIVATKHEEHEKTCAERYASILKAHTETTTEIKGFKNRLIIAFGGTICGLITVIAKMAGVF